MPSELGKEFLQLLAYLLPGFIAAWIYYGLTSHPKPSQFERVVQALIFTIIIQTFVPLCEFLFISLGKLVSIGTWNEGSKNLTSLGLALIIGLILAKFTNNDLIHEWFRKFGFTSRTSHPSEWFYVFSKKVTFVILHFEDGRRLYGWPKEWPIECDKGQFYIQLPCWLDEGKQIDLPELDGILVKAKDVKWVEFLNKEQT
jgi:hypothetical protein